MTHNAHAPYLFETPFGSVLHCACCGRVQIAFRGLTLLLSRPCYEQLQRKVAQATVGMRRGAGGGWFRVSTDAGELAMPLRANETVSLHDLLCGARAMLDLKNGLRATAAGLSQHSTCS